MLILILTFGFCTALISAIGIGRAAPNPARDFFTSPDGSMCEMPCLFGIRPGHTTVREAIEMLHMHPLTRTFIPANSAIIERYDFFDNPAFIGDGGQVIYICIFPEQANIFTTYDEILSSNIKGVRIGSFLRNEFTPPDLPKISNELIKIWHKMTFLYTAATLGSAPQHIGIVAIYLNSPFVDGYSQTVYLETFYYKKTLIFTYFPPEGFELKAKLDQNPLSSIVVLNTHNDQMNQEEYKGLRFKTGFPTWDYPPHPLRGLWDFIESVKEQSSAFVQ